MLKKLLIGAGLSISLLIANSNNLSINLSNVFNQNNPWVINFDAGKTYYFMSPVDINFSDIQNILTNTNQTIWLYRWYQRASLVNADFGIDVLGVVQITKDKIVYWIQNNGSWESANNFNDFESKMDSYATGITDSSKLNIFKNSYVPGFQKIYANKIYLIQPSDVNLSINFNMALPNNITQIETQSENIGSGQTMSNVNNEETNISNNNGEINVSNNEEQGTTNTEINSTNDIFPPSPNNITDIQIPPSAGEDNNQ